MKTPKQSLRSIKDVYDRLKWDGAIDSSTIYIGYQDRMRGLVEMPYADFRPGGRVPWDRIQYFRMADVRIWDRERRIDLVFGSGDTPADAVLIGDAAGPEEVNWGRGWPRVQAERWLRQENRWAADHSDNDFEAGKWKILSLNVLSNYLMPARPKDDLRYLALLDFLAAQNADLMALQEVDQHFMRLLRAQPWVQREYYVADNAGIGAERTHFECLIMRMTPEAVVVPLIAEQSRSIAAQYSVKGQRLTVVCLHLVSDWREGAGERRETFLRELVAQLPGDHAVMLLGDFNFGDEYRSPSLTNFEDGWQRLHPTEAGITYDGQGNALAQLVNPNARVRRIDRMFLQNDNRFPFIESMEIVAAQDAQGQTLSDHHALVGQLSFVGSYGAMRQAPKVVQSALCLIPPMALWTEIQALRREYDPSFVRWMPHINILYGFIPEEYFPEATVALQAELADFDAFELRFDGFSTFEHSDSTTIYLKPDDAATAMLRKLQAATFRLFPQCNDSERFGQFHPHLTVAKIPHSRKKEVAKLLTRCNAHLQGMHFTVNTLALISRDQANPFSVKSEVKLRVDRMPETVRPSLEIALGAQGLLSGKLDVEDRNIALAKVQKGIQQIGSDLLLIPVGSTALGAMLPGSDLDFVCLGKMPTEDFLAAAPKRMDGLRYARVARNALVPALKLYFADFSADVSYVQLSDAFPLTAPGTWPPTLRERLSPTQARALRAATDAPMLLQLAGDQPTSYRMAVIALKAWAQAQRVQGNAFGYPGGFAWALMLAQVGPHATPEAWLKAFLEDFVHRDWKGALPGEEAVPMLLLSGETPPFNVTRNVSANTLRILQNAAEEALLRIWSIEDGESTWLEFFAPSEVNALANIVLRWQAPTDRELEFCSGWLQSQIFGLVQRIEAIPDLQSRPDSGFTAEDKGAQAYRIALLSYPDEVQAEAIHDLLSEIEEDFICQPQRPSGASIRTALEFL